MNKVLYPNKNKGVGVMIITNIVKQVDDSLLEEVESLYNKIKSGRNKNNNHSYLTTLVVCNTLNALEDLIKDINKAKNKEDRKIKKYSQILDLSNVLEKDVRKTISTVLSYFNKRYYNDKRKNGWRIKVYDLKNNERNVLESIIKPFPNITMKDDIDVWEKDIVLITMKEV
jgi:hypothetical protein